jgi:YD repeat-containing protein
VTSNAQISDRERAGLRGPVRTVSQGSTKREYDPARRLISNRWLANPDSESADSVSIETHTYDGSGRLLIDTLRVGNGAPVEKVYSYDDQGRLLRIVDGRGGHAFFQYDEQGGKTEVRDLAHKSDDREGGVATGMDLMFADVEGDPQIIFAGIRNPSRMKTIYNQRDQPIETQALDAYGRLLSRILRTYDEMGRITYI